MGSWHKFDHIGILVKDDNLEKAMEFYKKLFGFDLPKTGPYSEIVEQSNRRYALISSKGTGEEETFIEFLPSKDNYALNMLNAEGTIVELCITVDDIEEWFDKVKKMGLTPINPYTKKPLLDKNEIVTGMVTKSRFFYLHPSETFGTLLEILERPGQPYRKK